MDILKSLVNKRKTVIAYQKLFSSEEGKLVLKDLMKSCHFYTTSFTGEMYESAYREGERSVVLRLLNTIKLDPREYDKLIEGNQGEDNDGIDN